MAEAYIIEAVRTPAGRRGGELSRVHPADLGAHVITALLNRVDVDPTDVDDVIFGCVDTVGPQAGDIARTSWLAAGFPEQVPGVTVDRQCGSSQQALHFAAQAVMSGTADVIVAGGVQNMSQVPIGSAMTAMPQVGSPFEGCEGWQHRYGDEEVNQFRAADLIAVRWDLSRRELEEYALQSHLRAITAIKEGRFDREIAPVNGVAADECPRPDTSAEKMAALQPLRPGGRTTAALSSQISDGASAVLVVSERAVREHKLTPRARVHHISARGSDPIYMLTAPIRATKYALERAGMSISDIDLFEINEAFASVALAWAKELKVDLARVNVNGGALALGHPIGATGTKLFTTLLHELERTGGRYGLQTMCEGGGQANVTIIERL
ncbi:acetyl-CoA C-acetyltransferase [Lentzea aerocolonigenes]|uniref:acetyl-CoA C-acetyltransferase n=1 Tax=Lentzea aerocolonigenes TaxID=68170 RepID=UPI0004C4464A|nr:acetyl-CoA C-acetyltransferase [Lentzea aerocolonigenes]MCP2242079.1 acetyl-CoA C-acetyltransferase [Lentzea aerocolonigenes]